MVYVYPKAPIDESPVSPEVWRYPTAVQTLCPRWGAQHSFLYNWDLNRTGPTSYSQSGNLSKSKQYDALEAYDDRAKPEGAEGDTSALGPAKGPAMDKVLDQLQDYRKLLADMREELNDLDRHVDRLMPLRPAPGAPKVE